MAYKSDFYIPENIIGYTGQIEQNPTVYFLKGPPQGPHTFGHITQGHQIGPNEGREKVCRAALYEMRASPQGTLEEWADGVMIHPSRSPFISARNLSAKKKWLLSTSIARFTE